MTSTASLTPRLPPRYQVRGLLGQGGMGVVYRVFDAERGQEVALKVLKRFAPTHLAHFKQEYRALTDLVHPNLVGLHELVVTGERAFLTMEIVQGLDFVCYAWLPENPEPLRVARATARGDHEPTIELPVSGDATAHRGPNELAPRARDYDRVRRLLIQLARGLGVLHEAGRIHCDVKPSNVIVTPEERVVLVDFGLVRYVDPKLDSGLRRGPVGTPSYLAPEVRAGAPPTPAADWFSAGVMLFQALAGRRPSGPVLEAAGPPLPLPVEVPNDLRQLCQALLDPRPSARPSAADVLGRLRAERPRRPPAAIARFVGRDAELEQLLSALDACAPGRAVVAVIHGRSGVGKTALLEELARRLQKQSVVVLASRCYERESVPFKALDGIVEGLAQFLGGQPERSLRDLLAREPEALAAMFPVLRPLLERVNLGVRTARIVDARERRERAFSALRGLLERAAQQHRLVMCIDDVQWGDADGASLLGALLVAPNPPPVLWVLACRREEKASAAWLRTLSALPEKIARVEIPLEPLSMPRARELVLNLAATLGTALSSELTDALAAESAGSPFLLQQLVLDAREASATVNPSGLIERRLAGLSKDPVRLLQVLAVAGRPLEQGVAERAADIEAPLSAWASLRHGRWVSTSGPRAGDQAQVRHDKIREVVLEGLDERQRGACHLRLASSLSARGRAEPELMAIHLAAGGEHDRAGPFAAAAADRARGNLEFDRAARFYEMAREAKHLSAGERLRCHRGQGECLALAGRGAEASRALLEAAALADPREARQLEAHAAQEALAAGLEDEGLRLLGGVLRTLGLRLPRTRARALLWLVADRLRLWLRGHRVRERGSSEEALLRIDLLHAAAHSAVGFQLSPTGAALGTRALRLALEAGEPKRCARALLAEAALVSQAGRRTERRARALFERAWLLAQRCEDPYLRGFATLSRAHLDAHNGRLVPATAAFEEAERIFREQCRGAQWEITLAIMGQMAALHYLGQYREVSRRLPGVRRRAEELGRVNELALHGLLAGELELVGDRPAAARDFALEHAARLHRKVASPNLLDLLMLHFHLQIDLYEGRGARAWSRVREELPSIARTGVLWVMQLFRVETLYWRAGSAVAAAQTAGPGSAKLRRAAARDARALERERVDYATVRALIVRAALASQADDADSAVRLLGEAAALAGRIGLSVLEAAALRRQGEILSGQPGRQRIATADTRLEAEGVRNPERFVTCLVPGIARPGDS